MDTVKSFYAKDRAAWRAWLVANHDKETGVWLVYDKGAARTMTWQDIVQESLCFGWIDSRPGKVSETQSKIYISRRKPKSVWSKINKGHVELLKENGLMTDAGLQAIEVAQANGSWDTLNRSDNLELPKELVAALSKNKKAKVFFDSLSDSSKRNTLQWLYDAKTSTTVMNRATQVVSLCADGIKPR